MKKILGAAVAAILTAGSANAALVTKSFVVTMDHDSSAPFATVVLDFSVTFNNSNDIAATTTGLTINNFSLAGYPSLLFTYRVIGDVLVVATNPLASGYQNILASNTFGMTLLRATADDAYFSTSAYTVPGQGIFRTASGFISAPAAPEPAVAVPEPITWAMFIGGFGLIGAGMRNRKRVSVSFA